MCRLWNARAFCWTFVAQLSCNLTSWGGFKDECHDWWFNLSSFLHSWSTSTLLELSWAANVMEMVVAMCSLLAWWHFDMPWYRLRSSIDTSLGIVGAWVTCSADLRPRLALPSFYSCVQTRNRKSRNMASLKHALSPPPIQTPDCVTKKPSHVDVLRVSCLNILSVSALPS